MFLVTEKLKHISDFTNKVANGLRAVKCQKSQDNLIVSPITTSANYNFVGLVFLGLFTVCLYNKAETLVRNLDMLTITAPDPVSQFDTPRAKVTSRKMFAPAFVLQSLS
jgi:hypothetical protein